MSAELTQDLVKQFTIMRQMLQQLPPAVSEPLLEQLTAIVNGLRLRDTSVREHVIAQLDDVRLNIKAMEFDLIATKTEKRQLEDRLRDAGLE